MKMEEIIRSLCKKYNIKKNEIKYIGYTDTSMITGKKNSKLLQFNIMKVGHKKYGSTIGYVHKY